MGRFLLCVGVLSVLVEFVISTWIAARREWQAEARLEERLQERRLELDG